MLRIAKFILYLLWRCNSKAGILKTHASFPFPGVAHVSWCLRRETTVAQCGACGLTGPRGYGRHLPVVIWPCGLSFCVIRAFLWRLAGGCAPPRFLTSRYLISSQQRELQPACPCPVKPERPHFQPPPLSWNPREREWPRPWPRRPLRPGAMAQGKLACPAGLLLLRKLWLLGSSAHHESLQAESYRLPPRGQRERSGNRPKFKFP